MSKIISLDAMGGDNGPQVTVLAALKVLRAQPDLHIIFVGDQDILSPLLQNQGADCAHQWEIHHASQQVSMDDQPLQALRHKKDSSMRVALNLVKERKAQACVSAGNTGALVATAHFVLQTLPGIHRPAIIGRFPTKIEGKEVYMLDLGANVDSTAHNLYQFAMMGSTLVAALTGIAHPKISLLNIGEEQIKGNEQVKKAAELIIQDQTLNYVGFIEANMLFSGETDVVVCDGFVGNVTLKACEGASKLIHYYAKQTFKENWLSKLLLMPALPVLKRLNRRVDPRYRNGAILLGLNEIVVKSHGSADVTAFVAAIQEAVRTVERSVPALVRHKMEIHHQWANPS